MRSLKNQRRIVNFGFTDSRKQVIRVAFADSGIGIPPYNIARIFEPFFTTKGEQDIGIGLWVANGIVGRLGGSIQMRSSVRPAVACAC
jgi:two-component system NtrC family sensor kinase